MNIEQFSALQGELWNAFSPLAPWLLAVFLAGGILLVLLIFTLTFIREWVWSVQL